MSWYSKEKVLNVKEEIEEAFTGDEAGYKESASCNVSSFNLARISLQTAYPKGTGIFLTIRFSTLKGRDKQINFISSSMNHVITCSS